MIKSINTYPHEILYQEARTVTPKIEGGFLTASIMGESGAPEWDDEVKNLVQDLKDTATNLQENGTSIIGLAANQIWDQDSAPPAIFIIKVFSYDANKELWAEFINPSIKGSGGTIKTVESCLSIPEYSKSIPRKRNVEITFQTLQTKQPTTIKFYGAKTNWITIPLQHEYDHLIGKLIK